MCNNDLDQLLMNKSYFAVSMGFINTDAPDISNPQQENVFSAILKAIAKMHLDSGAKIYLRYPVISIQSMGEVFEAITEAGCCIMSFEKEVSLSEVIDSSYAVVKDCVQELLDFSNGIGNMEEFLNHAGECFRPYVITSDFDSRTPIESVTKSIEKELEGKVSFGRSLSLDSKDSLIRLLSQKHAIKVA